MASDDDKVTFKTKLANIGNFIYNSETKFVLGRSCGGWGFIFVFYLTYYGFLAGLFSGLLSVFLYATLNENVPYLTGPDSIIEFKPGFHMKPIFNNKNSIYAFANSDEYTAYSETIEKYKELGETFPNFFKGGDKKNCLNHLEPYARSNVVCLYISLNYVYGWNYAILKDDKPPTITCKPQNKVDSLFVDTIKYQVKLDELSKQIDLEPPYSQKVKESFISYPLAAIELTMQPHVLVSIECIPSDNILNVSHEPIVFQVIINGPKKYSNEKGK